MTEEEIRAREYNRKMRARARNKRAMERALKGNPAAKRAALIAWAPLVGWEEGWGQPTDTGSQENASNIFS